MMVFPMAGASRRFREAGYTRPKYMLRAHQGSLFHHAVRGFSRYFNCMPFLFICREGATTAPFIHAECRALGLKNPRIVALAEPTIGQAETVALGLMRDGACGQAPLTIFNIDTFRPNFTFPDSFDTHACDGYLEVFPGAGSNWSYVRPAPALPRGPPAPAHQVVETAEKRPISPLSCTGLYHFRRAGDFLSAYRRARALPPGMLAQGELFVAPLYNDLIADGADIRFHPISREAVVFCGVPQEYDLFVASAPPSYPPHRQIASSVQRR